MKITIRRRLSALALSMILMLSVIPVAAAAGETITVKVDPAELELTVGGKSAVSATVWKGDQQVPDAVVKYASTDGQKVKVNPTTGAVEALEEGKDIEIKAVYEYQKDPGGEQVTAEGSCKVTVKAAPPKEVITLVPSGEVIYDVGDPPLTVKAEGVTGPVKWSTDDPKVADVDSTTGTVTFVSPGKTAITATAETADKPAKLQVIVSGINMQDSLELLVGRSETLTVGQYGNADLKTITWASSNISVADVKNGKVSAYNPGTTEITATAGSYSATCAVTVKEDVASAVTGSMRAGEVFAFSDIMSDLNSKSYEQIGTRLEYVSGLSVDPRQGILYCGYSSPDVPGSGVGGLEKYYVSAASHQKKLTDVVFVPSGDFGGTANIHYTGHGQGKMFSGSIRLDVQNTQDVAYNTAENRALHFDTETFSNVYRAKTGRVLSYVTFQLPSSSKGTLYYNYSETGQYSQRVTSQTRYYLSGGSILLENVSFLPAEGYTGVVTIPYQGTDTSGFSHNGKITITVYSDQQQGDGDIVYQTSAGGKVRFDVDDFQRVCQDLTGSSLNYIYISQPSVDKGKLYYQYVNQSRYDHIVSDTTRYFRSSTPRISNIDFVADNGADGTVTIPYTGYSSTGERFEGHVTIRLSGQSGTIHYSTTAGRAVDFSGLDFQEACQTSNGAALDYVRFELPSSYRGKLYYRYTSSGNPGSQVSERERYTSSSLSQITFVPARDYEGTVSIPFSGYDTRGDRFSGTVEITVGTAVRDELISYSTVSGGVVAFDADSFDRVCRSMTGGRLSYVRFDLPASRYGKLFYQYHADRGTGTSVSSGTNYYRSSSYWLDDVSFVADKSYVGNVNISYYGKSTEGKSFDGVVQISVGESQNGRISYKGSSLPVKFKSVDFINSCSSLLSGSLSYVEFETLPNSVYGKLMITDQGQKAVTKIAPNTRYYVGTYPTIDEIFFVAKAGFQGTLSIPYKAADTRGHTATGTISIEISDWNLQTHFTDLDNFRWAAPSIEFLYSGGVVNGYSSTTYGPAGKTSRGAFTLMLCRLFDFQPRTGAGFQDVPANSVYASAVVTAKELGIVSGNGGKFYPEQAITRQQAIVMLERAMRVAGWNVSSAPTSVLDAYADGGQVSGYARSAMASMVKMGVMKGDKNGKLNPQKQITRAEMAVILHRLLTV